MVGFTPLLSVHASIWSFVHLWSIRTCCSLVLIPPLLLTKWLQKGWCGIFGPIRWSSPSQIVLANQIWKWWDENETIHAVGSDSVHPTHVGPYRCGLYVHWQTPGDYLELVWQPAAVQVPCHYIDALCLAFFVWGMPLFAMNVLASSLVNFLSSVALIVYSLLCTESPAQELAVDLLHLHCMVAF